MSDTNYTEAFRNNIYDCALIFEGGGMRACYTSGLLNVMLENELYFNYVVGVSAGSSCSVNYLSRDPERSRRSFVELAGDPRFGNIWSFLRGEGFFRAEFIYEEAGKPQGALPFKLERLHANPAQLRVPVLHRDTGEIIYFSKDDMQELSDVMKIVRCSSTLPFFMRPTQYRGSTYYDGGMGAGLPIDIAQQDGFNKFFVVLTRPRGYRKKAYAPATELLIRSVYRKHPKLAEAICTRHISYNKALDELEVLERQGQAYVVYPEDMSLAGRENDVALLAANYEAGYKQGLRDLPDWQSFLKS